MIGQFKFLGENGSLGFKTGKTYSLDVKTATSTKGEYIAVMVRPMQALNERTAIRCPYQTWNAFFKNWKPVVVIYKSI